MVTCCVADAVCRRRLEGPTWMGRKDGEALGWCDGYKWLSNVWRGCGRKWCGSYGIRSRAGGSRRGHLMML